MLECVVSRDYFRPTKEAFKRKKELVVEGYKPVWQKYQEVMDERRYGQEERIRQKRDNECNECTFKPDMEYSMKTGKKILLAKKLRRQVSLPTMSIRERNLQDYRDQCGVLSKECTFHPEIDERSRLIHANILENGKDWSSRLAVNEHHDRMNHIAKIAQEAQENISFRPDIHESEDFGIHHKRKGTIHERLFHHDKHEYWHGDERGIGTGEMNALSTMPEWADTTPTSEQISPQALKSEKASPSAASPSADAQVKPAPKGEVNVEYRQTLLGLMEACERWGTRVETEAQGMSRQVSPSTASRGTFTPAARTPEKNTAGAGHPQAKGNARARSVTPPPASARSAKASARR